MSNQIPVSNFVVFNRFDCKMLFIENKGSLYRKQDKES